MIEDMNVRKFSAKTRHDYIRCVETFAKFLGRSPDTAATEDLRRYQVHQTESGINPPAMNSSASALRFFFKVTLGRADLATQLARIHYPRRLPRVLSPEDVGRLIEAAPGPGLKYKAALSVAYGAGLRASEVVALKVSNIDGKRISIRHDHAQRSPENPAYANWRIGQSRVTAPRICQTIKNQPRRTVSSNKDAPNQRFGLKPTRQNCCPLAAAGCGLSVRRHQIPIAAPQPCPISRGFLLWRLSDDGPGACRSVHEE